MIVFRAGVVPAGDRFVGLGIENLARFGFTSVQQSTFVNSLHLTDTTQLMLPINCVMADNQPLKVDKTEIDVQPANFRFRSNVSTEGPRRLSPEQSTFTVKKSTRGYD